MEDFIVTQLNEFSRRVQDYEPLEMNCLLSGATSAYGILVAEKRTMAASEFLNAVTVYLRASDNSEAPNRETMKIAVNMLWDKFQDLFHRAGCNCDVDDVTPARQPMPPKGPTLK